jgi:hypothetical protein
MNEMTEQKKYGSLKELIAAIKSGEVKLDPNEGDGFTLDNDSTPFYITDPDDPSDCIGIYNGGNPSELLEEALTLLGVPWENA